ncbi:L-lactate dehydrogenase [Limosilactobacillus reuteri]|uniref:L-lactate dehydrogenase n=1 Tax=Limosilactobacillus reuteri TaxID=1598 RepID=A0AAE5MRC9_LIMRT|nr:L-lactate dehydrogenase [Limosilactobacillus reuteri]OTA44510.1 L-lactate dehydrogenase [Limosilactobacillus reuteri]OTA84933.1 L-lactate dehydrogenase [Limosilactobacillus reuteri]
MTRKVAVVGMGHVGATVAHYLVAGGFVDDLALFDTNEAKVQADALDLRDAMANLPYHTNLTVNDESQLRDCDVVVSALGKSKLVDTPDHDRFAEFKFTRTQVPLVAKMLVDNGFHGKLVDVTNPCDVITSMYQKLTGLPKEHVMGTGTLLDSARMRARVGEALKVDSRSVVGFNLGEHGNSQFTAWSTVRVLGKPVTELAKERGLKLSELEERARQGGYLVYQGKKYTNYGVATAAVWLTNALLNDARTEMPVSNYREEYGTYLSYPAVVGRDGVVEQLHLDLTPEEEAKLATSATYIKERLKKEEERANQLAQAE